jgi:hypothetical protein
MADARAIRFTSESRTGVGTTFECDTRIGPFTTTDLMRVTAWREAEVMGIQHTGVVTGEGEFVLAPLPGNRSRFTWREELTFPWKAGGPVAAWVGRPLLRRIWRNNLERLREIIERQDGGTS